MSGDVVDLDQMMATLAKASDDPNGVTVGEFAKAVQSLQAELKMLEVEVGRLTGTVTSVFGEEDAPAGDAIDAEPAQRDIEGSEKSEEVAAEA